VTEMSPTTAPNVQANAAESDSAPACNPLPDRELLRRYVRGRDEAAFAELVRRQGRLVMGVCRRVLRSEHDVEDAFQATFLVLARDAGRIRKSDSLAAWLHGVAYRTSLRAADSSRRRSRLLRELTMIEDATKSEDESGPLAQVAERHQQQALDEELSALSDNYRSPLVLHYLDGKSNEQVADELGLTIAAVEGRLKRGKRELRLRLARRGIGLSVAVSAMQAVQSSVKAAPPDLLLSRTIDAGLSYAGGEAAGPVYSPEIARLAGQELITMSTTSAVTLAAIALVPLTLGFAGHDPVADTAESGVVVNTLLAQADAAGKSEEGLLESDPFDSGGGEPASTGGFGMVDPNTGAGMEIASDAELVVEVEEEVEAKPGEGVSDVQVTTVHKGEDGRTAVVIRFERDGKQLEKLVWLNDDEVETRDLEIPEEFPSARNRSAGDESEAASKRAEESLLEAKSEMQGLDDYQTYDDRFSDNYGMEMSASGRRRSSASEDILDYAKIPPSEMRIHHALEQQTQAEFIETPLQDALDYLSQLSKVPILIDKHALEEVGIPTDEPINLMLTDVKVESVFDHILRPLGLTTIIRDEVLQVTTTEVANEYLVTRVYNIRQLGDIETQELTRVIEMSLPEAKWETVHGEGGTLMAIDGALVVKQTQAGHTQVVDLLNQLQRHRQMSHASRQRTSQSDPFGGDPTLAEGYDESSFGGLTTLRVELRPGGHIRCEQKAYSLPQLVEHVRQQSPLTVQLRDYGVSHEDISRVIKSLRSIDEPGFRFLLQVVEPGKDDSVRSNPPNNADDRQS